MKKQALYIEELNWYVYILYDTKITDINLILNNLRELNCVEENIENARRSMILGRDNIGLTYSSCEMRKTMMVIGTASSLEEFMNTAFHECFHVVSHICGFNGIDMKSEDAAYLSGDIAEQMHHLLSMFTCHCGCRNGNGKKK